MLVLGVAGVIGGLARFRQQAPGSPFPRGLAGARRPRLPVSRVLLVGLGDVGRARRPPARRDRRHRPACCSPAAATAGSRSSHESFGERVGGDRLPSRRPAARGRRGRVRGARRPRRQDRGHRGRAGHRGGVVRAMPRRRSSGCGRSRRRARRTGVTVALGCGLAPGPLRRARPPRRRRRSTRSTRSTVCPLRVFGRGERRVGARRAQRARTRLARRRVERRPRVRPRRSLVPGADRRARLPHRDGRRRAARRRVPRRSVVGVRLGEPHRRGGSASAAVGDEGEWGATRVEVYGRRGRSRDVRRLRRDRTHRGRRGHRARAHGRADSAAHAGSTIHRPGVHGLGALVDPVPFLCRALRTRRARRHLRGRADQLNRRFSRPAAAAARTCRRHSGGSRSPR